jgi:hypothetical protein
VSVRSARGLNQPVGPPEGARAKGEFARAAAASSRRISPSRTVAQEAGWSAGALRHYFRTQSEPLDFAIELAAEQIRQRVGALELADDPRHAVEQLLSELLPLDDDRRQDVRQS